MDATSTVTGVIDFDELIGRDYESWAQKEALRLFAYLGSWQEVADNLAPYLRRSPSAWWSVAEGHKLTTPKINALLRHAGKPMIPAPVEVPPCPTCGGVHIAGDCGGRPVAAVVTLAPGEVVVKQARKAQRKRKAYHSRPCLSDDPAERLRQGERIVEEARLALIKQSPSNAQAALALLDEWMREDGAPDFDASSIEPLQLRDMEEYYGTDV